MKTFLLSLTVVTCMVVTESAPLDAFKLVRELDEIKDYLVHQESVMCSGNLMVPGNITSPEFPNNYPANLSCVWTLSNLPEDTTLRFDFRTFALADSGDVLEFFSGGRSVARFAGGTRKRSFRDEPSDRDGLDEDAGDYYDDSDKKDYYYYDGRRKKEHYFHQRRKRQMVLFSVTITGDDQEVRVVFTTNAAGSATGFAADVSQQGDETDGNETDGGATSESGASGASSDEEEP